MGIGVYINRMSEIETNIKLIEAAARGERKGCDAIVRQFGQTMFGIIARLVADRRDAEELTQDALLRGIRQIGSYDPTRAPLKSWFCRIAYRTALNHLRRPTIETASIDDLPPPAESDMVDSFMREPDDHRVELLQRAIRRLTDDEQLLVTLFYYEEMPLADIAYIIAQTPNALGVRLHRIRQKLYNMIKQQDAL